MILCYTFHEWLNFYNSVGTAQDTDTHEAHILTNQKTQVMCMIVRQANKDDDISTT